MTVHRPSPLRRRTLLVGLGALVATPAGCDSVEPHELWISAQGDKDQTYGLAIAADDGSQTTVETGFRGHGIALHPDGRRVAMFARRPGDQGVVIDVRRGQVVQRFESAPNHRLAGHGCFSADGTRLLTVEADAETAAGMIVVRDVDTLEVVAELDSYGVGPHEVALMPDGRTLAVANGGLLTRPESGAEILNLESMRSTLTYIDLESGARVGEHTVADDKSSIRHLSVLDDGTVVVVMQVQREAVGHDEPLPLIAVHTPGAPLRALADGVELGTAMADYAGGVAVDPVSRLAAVTSPRGNLVAFWDIDSGATVGHVAFDDVSGVSLSVDHAYFVLTGSGGQVRRVDTATLADVPTARIRFSDIRWDNHLIAIPT